MGMTFKQRVRNLHHPLTSQYWKVSLKLCTKNVKVSYGYVDNISQKIKQHNKKVLMPEITTPLKNGTQLQSQTGMPIKWRVL